MRPTTGLLLAVASSTWLLAACGQQAAGTSAGATPSGAAGAVTTTLPVSSTVDASAGMSGTVEAQPPASTPDGTQIAVAQAFEFPRLGDEDAVVVIYEFSDYRCPYCRQFWEQTFPKLKEKYLVPGGKVALDYVDFPIEDHGIAAVVSAEAAHCAGEQDLYWEMHEAIFGKFAEMNDLPLDDEAKSIDFLVDVGDEVGADTTELRACLESKRYRPTVATVYRDARDADVGVTPTFLVGINHIYTNEEGKVVFPEGSPPREPADSEVLLGFLPWEEFGPVVERQLALAQGTPWPTPTARPTLTPSPTPTPKK